MQYLSSATLGYLFDAVRLTLGDTFLFLANAAHQVECAASTQKKKGIAEKGIAEGETHFVEQVTEGRRELKRTGKDWLSDLVACLAGTTDPQ
jgi:hypothetical protein